MDIQPWERLLWSGRSLSRPAAHHALTDFRLVSVCQGEVAEVAIDDIGDIRLSKSRLDPLLRVSTIVVQPRDRRRPSLLIRRIRRGEQLAALLDLLSTGSPGTLDPEIVHAALASTPWRSDTTLLRNAALGMSAAFVVLFGLVAGLHGSSSPVAYPPDDAIYPGGEKRPADEIVRFMETTVMPWAKEKIGPLVGGGSRVTCITCHGQQADARAWQMPGVAALPKPALASGGWERYSNNMDAQMRNAIYGFGAESDNQARAAYMREVVMPGMAQLLHRPAYDFTKPYEYNRARVAFGCYHCHLVK